MKLQRQQKHTTAIACPRGPRFVLGCSVGIAVLFGGSVTAGTSDGTVEHRTETAAAADSLRMAIEQLKKDAAALRRKAAAINDSIEGLENGDKDPMIGMEPSRTAPKDTVELLSREGTHAFLESFRGKKRGSRERGYGGGIGTTPGMFFLNVRPVRELLDIVTSTRDYNNISFPINSKFQGFFMMGITGYGALGNGLRVGGQYQGGGRSYSVRRHDSTFTADVHTSFGGFLLEKAAVSGNINWYAGGIAGGAGIAVNPTISTNSNPFSGSSTSEVDEDESGKLSARALLLELHGGFTYSMTTWFHIGADLATPLYFSPSGFKTPSSQSVTDGFVSVNPGFRIRIILGNIG